MGMKKTTDSLVSPPGFPVGGSCNLNPTGDAGQTFPRFGTKAEVAKMFGLCRRSVDNLLAKGCPHMKLGHRRVRFDLEDVREWAKREFSVRRLGKENPQTARPPHVASDKGAAP